MKDLIEELVELSVATREGGGLSAAALDRLQSLAQQHYKEPLADLLSSLASAARRTLEEDRKSALALLHSVRDVPTTDRVVKQHCDDMTVVLDRYFAENP